MKKLFVGAVCLLLVAGAAAYWYFHRSGDAARDVLPANAEAVAVLEPAELIEALGLPLDLVSKLPMGLEDFVEAIDLEKPVYAFVSDDDLSGASLNVKDAEKFVKAASGLGFGSEEQGGFRWLTNGSFMACLDHDKLLLCGPVPESGQGALRNKMIDMMRQSRQDVALLDKANRQTGSIRLCVSLGSLSKEQMPTGFDGSGAFLCSTLKVGKRDITLSANVEDKDGKPYSGRAEGEELLQPIDGLLPTVLPEKPFAWLCFGVKGENLLNVLRSGPQVSATLMMLNVLFFDADLMLKAIDGDVIVMMPKADFDRKEILLTARISNSDFLKNAKDWDTTTSQGGMSLRKRGQEDDYVFTFNDEQAYFGVRGDFLYLTSSERLANQVLQESEHGILQPMVAGKHICGSMDIAQIVEAYQAISLILRTMPQLREAVDAFQHVSLSANTPNSIELSIETNKPVKEVISNLTKLTTGK